jgi:hypothetical protein
MPRPVTPARLGLPDVQQFIQPLEKSNRSDLARALGLREMSDNAAATLQEAIAMYRASLQVHGTTIGNVKAAVQDLQMAGRKLLDALTPFTDPISWVDIETFSAMNPIAKQCLGVLRRLELVANAQVEQHAGRRVYPASECLCQFCGTLRLFFHRFADPALIRSPDATKHLRRFALAVFEAVGIDHADFGAHPERLDEMLRTDALAAVPPLSIEGTLKSSFNGERF